MKKLYKIYGHLSIKETKGIFLLTYLNNNDIIYSNIYDKPQEHLFMEDCDNKENKYMNQIGG